MTSAQYSMQYCSVIGTKKSRFLTRDSFNCWVLFLFTRAKNVE